MTENSLTYIANAGVMLKLDGKKILIDPLTTPGNDLYLDTEQGAREALLTNAAPYDHVDVVLVTHHHRDHFHAEGILALLEAQPGAHLVSSPEVIRRLKAASDRTSVGQDAESGASSVLGNDRWTEVDLGLFEHKKITCNGVALQIFRTLHDGEDYADVTNLMFVIKSPSMVVAQLGDSAPAEINFEGILLKIGASLDLVVANFPYIAIPAARKLVESQLAPASLAVLHFPDPTGEAARWTEVAKKSFARVRESYLPTVLLETLGETVVLPMVVD
jgi:L-ascorbate metabolism protein UlaG (beta-lactamase superfamily)